MDATKINMFSTQFRCDGLLKDFYTCVYTSKLTLEGKLVGKAHVNALVGSYLQDLELLPTSRYLQDELVGI